MIADVVVSITLNLGVWLRSLHEIGVQQVPAKRDDFKNGTGFSPDNLCPSNALVFVGSPAQM